MATEKANILVVDDLPEKLLVYRSILEELDQNVITARSGAEALKQVLLHEFAVILLDVNMPDMDGFETARLIRNRKKYARTPIIFVTSLVDELNAVQGYAQGAVDYILAPVAPEILRAKVKVFVDLYHMNQQVKHEAEVRVALAEERAKRAAAEEANRASAFLAQAGTVLANSMNFEVTLRNLARVAVPFLADMSVVSLTGDPARAPTHIEWAWADDQEVVQPSDPPRPAQWMAEAMERVFKSGTYELLPEMEAPPLDAAAVDAPGPRFLARSAVIFPLSARGKTLGTFALVFGASERRFAHDNVRLAADLAARAGIAVDNALLVRNIQQADRRKDEFLAMLAHELRNPLAPICNAVELLRLKVPPDADLRKVQDVIDRQLVNLTRLVDDLLDVSRITSGKIRLKLEALDVAQAVSSAVETSRPLIESRKHELIVSLPPKAVRVKADQTRLAQVLANLLNNAAKYTHEGGKIWLSAACEEGDVVFRVRDNGPGIPADILPCIFDLFTQADQSLERSQGGLGIGLTLVRRLVEMHQGSVQAFSKGPGQGSEFVVRLPALAEPVKEAQTNGQPVAPRLLKRRILIVDDNRDTAENLAMLMRFDGHEVHTAHDGLAALQAFSQFNPQVVILDIGLPKMNGYEVARRLRDQKHDGKVLLAALTGYGNEEDRIRSQEAGFDFHLVKPVRLEALRRLLARLQADAAQRLVPERGNEELRGFWLELRGLFMRNKHHILLSLFAVSLSASSLLADDEITVKGNKKIYGAIKSESGFGVTLDGKKDMIPAADIIDIRYERKINDPSRELYYEARAKEAAIDKSKNVRLALIEAADKYEATLKKVPEGPESNYYRRNVEFRTAYLRGRSATEFGDARASAMGELKKFAKAHKDSWQIAPALQKLAELQMSEKKYADAEKTYTELGQAQVSELVKQDAKFLAAKLSMQIGNLSQAEERFKELVAKLPEDSPIAAKARIAQIECLTLAKKTDEANQKLRQLIKEAKNNDLKALAHNALGKNLFDEGKFKEARWEFLWVDVVYNQDKAEHARSLYYLWHTFGKLNETERAQECLEALLNEQFTGVEYQRKAHSESNKK